MARTHFDIDGPTRVRLARLAADLLAIEPAVGLSARSQFRRRADRVADKAKSLAPKRTGRLASNISARTEPGGAAVVSTVPYARIMEFGGSHPVYGNMSNWVYQPARPHLGPAVASEENGFVNDAENAVTFAAAKVGFR